MSERIIYLGPEAPGLVCWAEKAADGAVSGFGRCPLADLAGKEPAATVVLVPGTDVAVVGAMVPVSRRRLALKNIAYILEERLADDIDNLHFACGPVGHDGQVEVAVVSRERMAHWLKMLQDAGLAAAVVVPALFAVPTGDGFCSVVLNGEECLVREETWKAYAVDSTNLGLFFASAAGSDLPKVRVFTGENVTFDPAVLEGREVELVAGQDLMVTLAQGFTRQTAIDLLQGSFSRHAGWRSFWSKWRLPLAVCLVLLLVLGGGVLGDYLRLRSEKVELDVRITALFLEAFPETKRVVNARAQMEQGLRELRRNYGSQDAFLGVYDRIAPVLMAAPGLSIAGLRFKDGVFDLALEADDLQIIDELDARLAEIAGIKAEIRSATADGGVVKARIQIGGEEI